MSCFVPVERERTYRSHIEGLRSSLSISLKMSGFDVRLFYEQMGVGLVHRSSFYVQALALGFSSFSLCGASCVAEGTQAVRM
jgi:hypothetical protein